MTSIFSEDPNHGKFLFVLLSFLSLFPEGVLLEDFVQFVEMPGAMQDAPQNWILPLIRLSVWSSEGDGKVNLRKLDSEVCQQLMRGTPKSNILKMFLEYRSEDHNNILCLRNISVGKQSELIIVVNYLVREVISESAKVTGHLDLLYAGLTNALIFHRLYLNSLLHYAKSSLNLVEDMVEGTQIGHGLFKMMDTAEIEDFKTQELNVPLFEVSNTGKSSMKAMFTHYQTSYNIILTESRYLNAVEGLSFFLLSGEAHEDENDQEIPTYVRHLEDTIMKIATLCRVFDENEILVVIERTAAKLRDTALGLGSPACLWLPYKVIYCLASQTFRQVVSGPATGLQAAVDLLVAQIDDMEYKLRDVKPSKEDEEMIKYCQCQINILKYYFISCDKVKKSNFKLQEYNGTKEELEKLVVEILNLMNADEGLNYLWIEWAKACLTLLEHNGEVAVLNDHLTLSELGEQLLVGFEQYKAIGCILKTYLCLGKSSSTEISLKSKLDYIKEGLKLAEEKNQEAIRKDFLAERQKILDEISKANAHKITYLQSRPLRSQGDCGASQIKANVRQILLSQPKDEVQIELNCDIFTESSFLELHKIANGCKLLILDLTGEDEVGLVAENDNLETYILKPAQACLIKNLLEDGASVEILFLMGPCGEKQAKQVLDFFKELKVKILVYFRPPDKSKTLSPADKYDFSQEYYFEQLKKIFLEKFMAMARKKKYLGRDVRSLVHECTSLAIDEVNHMVKRKAQLYWFDEKLDCFEAKNVPELKFTGESIGVIEPGEENGLSGLPVTCYFGVDSKAGIADASVKNWDSLGSEVIYANRHKEIVEIYDILRKETTSFVQVCGTEGVGKSFLIRQFESEIGRRKLFPHGVHYVDCADTSLDPKLRHLIKEAVDPNTVDLGLWFKQNHDCLVILDNFHLVSGNTDVIVPLDLFEEMTAAGVKLVFVVDQKEDSCLEFSRSGFQLYQVDPLAPEECLYIIVTYGACLESDKKIFFALGEKGREKFMKLQTFQDVVGFPEKLTTSIQEIICEALDREDGSFTFKPSSSLGTLTEIGQSPSTTGRRSIHGQISGFNEAATPYMFRSDILPSLSRNESPLVRCLMPTEVNLFARGCDHYTCKHCHQVIHR